MAMPELQCPAPVVARRLCDLLLSFPCAASGGVQWQVLVSKYEERHSQQLDLTALGQTSALGAATALLWDVLRIVDREDSDNPVVGVEDGVALTPQPGLLGCWPSLYQVLCNIVVEHGAAQQEMALNQELGLNTHSLLLSQLRPLLERHWHASFDESSLGFRGEDGTFVRFKKMKHLLHAVLRWRDERQAWQRSRNGKHTAIDEVLIPNLELVPSKKHNDLMLCCSSSADCIATQVDRPRTPSSASSTTVVSDNGSSDLQQEVQRLRSENRDLRVMAEELSKQKSEKFPEQQLPEPQLPADIFDDPFEPPPEMHSWMRWETMSQKSSSEVGSTYAGSEVNLFSMPRRTISSSSGWQSECTSVFASGSATPIHHAPVMQAGCTVVPTWFPFIQALPMGTVDVSVIPRGIVQSAREQIERIVGH